MFASYLIEFDFFALKENACEAGNAGGPGSKLNGRENAPPLMLEELRARRERGEEVDMRVRRRDDVLQELQRVRTTVPDIPHTLGYP